MPIYTYRCENCGHQFDKSQSFNDKALVACPECRKHALHKVYKPAQVVFKGSGFYVTDKKGRSSATVSSNGTSENGSKPKAEDKKSEKAAEKSSEKSTAKSDEESH